MGFCITQKFSLLYSFSNSPPPLFLFLDQVPLPLHFFYFQFKDGFLPGVSALSSWDSIWGVAISLKGTLENDYLLFWYFGTDCLDAVRVAAGKANGKWMFQISVLSCRLLFSYETVKVITESHCNWAIFSCVRLS